MVTLAFAAVVLLCVLCLRESEWEVPLTLREHLGVPRAAEPITCGVPLPQGAAADPSVLHLVDGAGAEVPAAFSGANRWWEDGSLKWVHVDLQRSLPAHGEEVLTLRPGDAHSEPATDLEVLETEDEITVTTGPLRFTVTRHGFDLFRQVWLDESGAQRFDEAHAQLREGPRGFHVSEGGRTAWAGADAESRVTVEDRNAFRVVLRAEGRHRKPDGSPLLDYVTRIIAYAGQSCVRINHAFLVRQGETINDYLSVDNLGLTLPLRLTPGEQGLRYRIGGSEAVHEGWLGSDGVVTQHQHGADAYTFWQGPRENWGGARWSAKVHGTGHTPRTGWVDLSDGARGLAVGVRDFWQLYPKAFEATAEGTLIVGLYPDQRLNRPLLLYPGMARTHELTLFFHGAAETEALSDRMAAQQSPLMLVAPPKWYCRDTRVFGPLVENDPEQFAPQYAETVALFERRFREALDTMLARRDRTAGLPEGDDPWAVSFALPRAVDEYGIINYGDGYLYERAGEHFWADNYYDFPHTLLVQYLRTGERRYLDHAWAFARHFGDVDISCHVPGRVEVTGGARPAASIAHVLGADGNAWTSAAFCFLKNQSLFDMWYLTADRRFLETAMLATGMPMTFDGVAMDEPRCGGHALICMGAAYEATGEQKYLDRGEHFLQKILKFQDEHDGGFPHYFAFQGGLVGEGYWRWHALTKDPRLVEYNEKLAAWLLKAYAPTDPEVGLTDVHAFAAFVGLGFASATSGDPRYLDTALRHARHHLPTQYATNVRDYAVGFRNSPHIFQWLMRESGE